MPFLVLGVPVRGRYILYFSKEDAALLRKWRAMVKIILRALGIELIETVGEISRESFMCATTSTAFHSENLTCGGLFAWGFIIFFFKALVVILSASWWVYFISLIITSYRPYPYGKATPFLRECQHSNAFAELVYYLVQILYGIRAFWWPSYLNSCQRSSSDVHCWHSLNRIQIWGDDFIFRKLGTC